MTYGIVERWYPASSLTERPAENFDVSWQGGHRRLIVTVWYADNAGEDDWKSAIVIFEDVFAFQVFDESMDSSGVSEDDAVVLKTPYPYGGIWPYLEVRSSEWVKKLAEQHGVWDDSAFRHLVITSRSCHLHVAHRPLSTPTFHSPP
jgi:hypothetical protein